MAKLPPRINSTAVAMLAFCAMGAAIALAESFPFDGVVTGEAVNVRAGAGQSYYTVTQLEGGQRVRVHESLFGWYSIEPLPDSFSFISKRFVELDDDGERGVVNGQRVRVLAPAPAGPDRSYRTQVHLNTGDRVRVLGEEGEHYRIAPPNEARLFVHEDYVEPAQEPEPAAIAEREPGESGAAGDRPDDSRASSARRPDDAADRVADAAEERESAADDEQAVTDADDAADEPAPLLIDVLSSGSIHHDGRIIGPRQVAESLGSMAEGNGYEELTLLASRRVPSEHVEVVAAAAYTAGFERVLVAVGDEEPALANRPEPDEPERAGTEDEAIARANKPADTEGSEQSDEAMEPDPSRKPPHPTLSDVEARYAEAGEMPIVDQPLAELRMDYQRVLAGDELSASDRRLVQARIEVLETRAELQSTLSEIESVRREMTAEDERRRAEDAARPVEYAAVGRLTASTLYTGENLPRLYRLVNPLSGLTIAYVRPERNTDAARKLNEYVGVVGDRRYDPSMKLHVINASRIDALAQDQARR